MQRHATVALALAGLCATLCAPGAFAEEPVRLGELIVRTQELPSRGKALSKEQLLGSGSLNAGQLIQTIPGVDAVYRGANAAEPVIRGLGWERVETRVGCLPLYGSCPSRMDPPASYVSAEALESAEVIKGLPSVTLGPGGTAGRLMMKTDYDRGEQPEPGFASGARATWDEGRDGFSASVFSEGGTSNVDLRAEANVTDLDDYESGDGKTVPAGIEEYGGSVSLGWRPSEGNRLFGNLLFKEERDVDFPALPMDIKESTAYIATMGYRTIGEGNLERIEVNAGFSDIDHLMNNENKPNRKKLEAETPSEARTYSVKADADLRVSDQSVLTLGVDAERLERDALRTRKMLATGMTFRDHIWPDVTRDNAGAFAEINWDASDTVALRSGLRVDVAESEADGATESIRGGYARYGGPDAAKNSADDVLWSGNLLAEWQAREDVLLFAGLGKSSRFPGVTEQYFAFAPAPGGFLVGNPSLEPEHKYEANAGIQVTHGAFDAELSIFAAEVDDYVYQTTVDQLDVNGDGIVDNVRGFRNVDAELYGGELTAVFRIAEGLTAPVALSYVAGRNTTDDRDLPEIPPLGGRAALKYQAAEDAWWCEAGMKFAARQDRIDETFPENETASYQVVHAKAGWKVTENLSLEAGVENLFDEDYNDHLSREALLPSGDLAAGDEVPAPGRYAYVTARVKL